MDNEEASKLGGREVRVRRDEDGLLGQAVDDNENVGEPTRGGELLDEVHGDGLPRAKGNGKLLQETIGLVTRSLRTAASRAGVDVVCDERTQFGPNIITADQFDRLVTTKVTSEGVIVLELQDSKTKAGTIWNVDTPIKSKKTVGWKLPTRV